MTRLALRDEILGDLDWDQSRREWRGRLAFTPKHRIAVSLHALSTLSLNPRREPILDPVRTAFAFHRKREWELRLQIAQAVVEHGFVAGEAADLPRHLHLYAVELFQGGRAVWRYSFDVELDLDFTVRADLDPTDLIGVRF